MEYGIRCGWVMNCTDIYPKEGSLIYWQVRDAIRAAVEAEREACAKAVCVGCSRGLPFEERDGDLLHVLPEDEHRPTSYGPGNRIGCDAEAIVTARHI